MLLASACDRFGLSLTLYRGQKTFVRGWRSFRGVASLSFTGLRERVVDLRLTRLGTINLPYEVCSCLRDVQRIANRSGEAMQISAKTTPSWSFIPTLRRFSLTLQARTLRCARLLSRAKIAPGPSTMWRQQGRMAGKVRKRNRLPKKLFRRQPVAANKLGFRSMPRRVSAAYSLQVDSGPSGTLKILW